MWIQKVNQLNAKKRRTGTEGDKVQMLGKEKSTGTKKYFQGTEKTALFLLPHEDIASS